MNSGWDWLARWPLWAKLALGFVAFAALSTVIPRPPKPPPPAPRALPAPTAPPATGPVRVEAIGGELMPYRIAREALDRGRAHRLTAVGATLPRRDGLGNETPVPAATLFWRRDAIAAVNWRGIDPVELLDLADHPAMQVESVDGMAGLVAWCRKNARRTPRLCAEVDRRGRGE